MVCKKKFVRKNIGKCENYFFSIISFGRKVGKIQYHELKWTAFLKVFLEWPAVCYVKREKQLRWYATLSKPKPLKSVVRKDIILYKQRKQTNRCPTLAFSVDYSTRPRQRHLCSLLHSSTRAVVIAALLPRVLLILPQRYFLTQNSPLKNILLRRILRFFFLQIINVCYYVYYYYTNEEPS